MIITTTGSIEGYQVVEHFRPIATSHVAATDIFSDMVASFSDVFGGKSATYQAHLDALYEDAIAALEQDAARVGANAIIGAKFDLGQISGKGTQMFMVSAVGTPVTVKTAAEIEQEARAEADALASKLAEHEARRERFAGASSALSLLADSEIAEEARKLRRIYGNSVMISYLQRKAGELGLPAVELTAGDIPEDLFKE